MATHYMMVGISPGSCFAPQPGVSMSGKVSCLSNSVKVDAFNNTASCSGSPLSTNSYPAGCVRRFMCGWGWIVAVFLFRPCFMLALPSLPLLFRFCLSLLIVRRDNAFSCQGYHAHVTPLQRPGFFTFHFCICLHRVFLPTSSRLTQLSRVARQELPCPRLLRVHLCPLA